MFLAVILAASLSSSLAVLAGPVRRSSLAGRGASRLPFDFFVKRVWLGIPLFAGDRDHPVDLLRARPAAVRPRARAAPRSRRRCPGLVGAVLFVIRGSAVSVSLAVLLVLTTPWADLLKSLQAMRVPQVFVLVLSMTYRYIFLFLHTLNGMFEARKSRRRGPHSAAASSGAGSRGRWAA